ncbi:hypothetical protein TS85_08275 [Sphingomonas hengshuiensis]|uniref:Autotransporter domain-containing protein n=1 Tax=Sphingomonas hengshuiensis TaxID=1609977 RepID=A0A7U4J7X4_9SPHN|nr:hypothetical protein TS85_08275 [Sphingomonas hengshuiensis]
MGTLENSGLINDTSGGNMAIFIGATSTDTISLAALNNLAGGTISAVATGIVLNTRGTIGTLTNSGRISGFTAVGNYGSIGSISNTGVIAGTRRGISNFFGGTIGTISNSGTISVGAGASQAAGGVANYAGSILALINTGTIISSSSSGVGNNTLSSSIGQITNSGLISGATGGLWNSGTMSQVTNTGRIIGAQAGVFHSSGTIGTINNSGTISGGSYGISIGTGAFNSLINSGTVRGAIALDFGSGVSVPNITNSGVIAGSIVNRSANVLTINGGTGATFGTLTGSTLTNKGSIISTMANLEFASGNLVLNSNINATGRTVVNDGATLLLNSGINLAGAFNQITGTLVVDPLGGLIATGVATASGGTIQSNFVSTSNYLAGTYTLLGGSSLNIFGLTVDIGTLANLDRSVNATGTALQLLVNNSYVGGTLATGSNAAALTSSDTGLFVATTGSIGTFSNTGTLGGAQFGVNNRGTIGLLSNSGRITNNNFTALWNQGSIGQLVNTGTITNSSWAILNSGTIGTLTNSGVIAGAGNAVQNNAVMTLIDNSGTMSGGSGGNAIAGVFGTVRNSGLFLGNVNGNGGTIGTIIGGSGGTVGTFTGFNGTSQGTLGVDANLTFASGALLLNDTITVKTAAASAVTVSNTGADITLSTIVNVNANFSQSAGSLNLGTAGKLAVTQAASITGGTITTGANGFSTNATYLKGAAGGTLVSGGVGSSYSGVSIVSSGGFTGLAFGSSTSGTNLLLSANNIYVGDTQASINNSDSISGTTWALYVANTGAIGTLINSGTLTGLNDGLSSNGSIGSLSNSGLISGGQKGLGNQNTITNLTNTSTGTILGGTAAGLQNDTSMGTLTNAGLISSGSAGFANYGTLGLLSNSGSINGGPQGIYLDGNSNAGTINNSGTITSGQSAVQVSGTLGSLVNSGYIGNATNALNVAGTLGTLVNANGGTLSGNNVIYVSGSLGGLSNSGVIKGRIDNQTANNLTITGGAAGTIGTLTGTSGIGTINNTLSNVVFASGNLLLNDRIIATGRTVSNTGASLSLTSNISITGNYSQSAGTLSVTPGTSSLIVSGAANLSGGTVAASLSSTGNYLASSYTLVSGGASSSLSGATVSTGTITGLASSSSISGNNLLLAITNDYVGGSLTTLANAASLTSASTGLYVATTGTIGTVSNTGTLGGAQFGVNNRGTIGTFGNSGRITNANFTALWNQGSIGQLVNSGTITNSSWAILNSGTIGTVTNSGVINGAGVAIQNNAVITAVNNSGTLAGQNALAGTFGTVINSGLIRGNINPSGGVIGTIIGGSGGAIGTFTGSTGTTQGTIGATGNLTFAAGALLLNDTIKAVNIAASALTVSNTGADITLATIVNVDGNFTQSAGTLNLGTTGKLVVTQAANFTGGIVAVGGFSATGNYLFGGTAGTLVSGGAGSSYSGATVNAGGITGLAAGAVTSGNDLVMGVSNYYVGGTLSSLNNTGTVSGVSDGVYVAATGSLGTLDNSGTLSGTSTGVTNLGLTTLLSNSGLIQGGDKGVYNAGQIGALINTGTITTATTASGTGLQNSGSIGTLSNSGLISIGIYNNGGTIGLIDNSGTLQGGAQALYITSGASLAGIANSGLIQGSIINDSAQDFTISGGTGAAIGTLTGMSGRGSIVNTASNLVFSSGNLLLNDDIDATGHSVVNSGAVITLPGMTSITGNYSQSAGSLLVDAGVSGLAVSGTATVTGGTIAAALASTGNYLAGDSYTLIQAASGSSYGGVSVTSGVTGLSVTDATATIGGNTNLLLSVANNYVGGTLGTIANTGTLSGTTPVYVASTGNLGLLSNSGTLSGSVAAINGLGTIGTIANSGLIQGPNAIVDAGGIGLVANSGTVMGDVLNTSGTNLTLTGGTGVNGVFTGMAGAQGTITSNADIVLASGNILLDDSVAVAGHTLVNSGASVQLDRTVNVTGDYSQTGGTLGMSLGTSSLAVSGTANISGGTIAVDGFSATGNYLSGTSAGTLVQGGTGSSYSGLAVNANIGVLEITGGTQGTNLVANVSNNYVGGTLATLDNTTSLDAGTAFYIAGTGSVGTLGNTSTVSGTFGVANQGAIAALNNSGTFNVGGTAISNNGSIGQLSNTGSLVAAASAGVYNGGTITALNNSGAIVNSQLSAGSGQIGAVLSTGTLGALTNSGTIAGAVALYNSGALGTIVNSGTFAGNIVNDAAQALVFVGGSAGTFGTLTGTGSGQGTITNTQGNVVFASGGMVLNDAINVGSGTVVNNGATVQLTSIVNITGNYSQASGTLALGLSSLQVSGVANLSGGRITTDQFDTSANYIVGNSAGTLVSGGAGSSYSGVSISSGITGLAVTTATGTIGSTVSLLLSARNDYIGGSLANLVNSGAITAVTTAAYVAASGSIGTLSNTGVLDGTLYGLNNNGTIGLIDNNGAIAGVVGVYNTGEIGTILNSGSMIDTPAVLAAGLNNAGTIGSVVNLGTISGESRGLYNSGTIASVANSGTIAGALAVYNGGSIGSFTNSGLVLDTAAPTSAALNNAGTLDVVTNSGTLSGATYGVLNSGTIGQFSNSGLIQATIAISNQSTGALPVIANTGVIAGNIENAAAQALTFTGGSGSSAGTLTGLAGGRGTITSAGGVAFTSGNMLLNDDIVASAVTNSGAVLGLAESAAITGDYSQTAGSLLLATGKQLNVSGAASLTGGSVATTLPDAANYLAGTSAGTLVTGGAGSNYTGVSVTTGPITGLALSAGASGNNLVVTAQNNYIGAGLASLTNSGSLVADYPVYVAASGSLGALSNSGTLSGSIAAIYNAGTLGPITNSGLIEGNIENISAQALTFTGGTGSTIGTLTGLAGGRGTISNSAGAVVFASGNMLLNDDVVASAVTNSGAVLSLDNSAAITGDFAQTAGSLVLATGKQLNVSGAATLSGGTVSTSLISAANYFAGSAAGTLVTGGAGSSYTGVSVVTAPITGLALTSGASGNDLVVTANNNYIGANLASLANSGSLAVDYPVYVAASGSLGALANSGTLSGSIAAIYNAGTLGPIANTGVIAGNIENVATQALTFTGGTGSTIGTLTGLAGGRGTITNSAGAVVFASGNLLLNDDVVASAVTNSGAVLSLDSSAAITGDFAQTAGSLVLATGKQLNVSGAATFSGGTVSTSLVGAANYLAGSTAGTLVTGGAGSSYTGVSVATAPINGLALTSGASGNNLVVTANNNYIGENLASLANSGSLAVDYPVYVAASGSLGALSNSGTLSGSIAAIYNAGTLGPIANTGVIAGNIENVATQALTFTGGTGSTIGTLTGLGGARGTISNSAGAVVFASGNMLLNDDVVASAVTNSGAVLSLDNSAAITGDFGQTAGSLVLATGKQINVSGAATLSGGTISTSLVSAANYLAGSAAGTLVTGGAGSSYAGVSVITAPITGLALSAGASGNNLVLTPINNYIGASLASLTNSGSVVADYPVYIASAGSLGTLSNSGTLSGSIAAIYNAGTLGPIANTGVIAGNIENLSTADLRIAGGSGTVFGTLTGYASGSQGTIKNLLSNMVVTGNLLLNDAVNVGTHSLINNGGTLRINGVVPVTGNYSQTGGTLLVGVTSTAAYGQLQVSGTASLTNATVKLVALGTGTIAAGDSYTVVKATGGLTYSNLTASAGAFGGTFFSVASGGATGLVLTVSESVQPTSFTATGVVAGGSGVGTGAALDAIADQGGTAGTPIITNILIPLAALTPNEQERGIIQLSPTQLTPQVVAIAVSPAVNAIVQHQEVLAANASGREERGLAAGSQGQRGAVWGQMLFNTAKRGVDTGASPYKASSYGVMVGADLFATSNLVAGGALSWVNSTADGRADLTGSRTRLDSVQATGYFTWQPGDPETAGLAIDGQLGFGYNFYRQQRRIDFLGKTAKASFDGQQYLGNLRVSYTVPLSDTASVTPFAGVREVHLKNAGYAETGGGLSNLQVRSLNVDSFGHEAGIQASGIFDSASGRFLPSLKVGWVHNYTNGPIPLTAVLGGVAFTSTSSRGARDGASLGAGLSFLKDDRLQIGVQYDGEVRRAFQSHSATIRVKLNF